MELRMCRGAGPPSVKTVVSRLLTFEATVLEEEIVLNDDRPETSMTANATTATAGIAGARRAGAAFVTEFLGRSFSFSFFLAMSDV